MRKNLSRIGLIVLIVAVIYAFITPPEEKQETDAARMDA